MPGGERKITDTERGRRLKPSEKRKKEKVPKLLCPKEGTKEGPVSYESQMRIIQASRKNTDVRGKGVRTSALQPKGKK